MEFFPFNWRGGGGGGGGRGLYTSLRFFHVYSGSRACLLNAVTRTPTVLSLLPSKEIGVGRRANNEKRAEMKAERARDLEGKKVADPLSLSPSSIPCFLLPSTSRYFSTKEVAFIAAPGNLLHVCRVRL